jgi:hypothetical protein
MPLNIMATRLERSCKDFLPNLKFIVNYTNRVQATPTNGESVEHITIEPAGDGKKIHAYRDGIFTQGEERRH